jgi:hypothetical protein
VIAVREIDHEPKGSVDFWTRAIENRMRQRGGYALLGSKDVKTAAGVPGKQLRFGHDEGNKPHVYHVTLFVTDDTLYVLEAGEPRSRSTGTPPSSTGPCRTSRSSRRLVEAHRALLT